MKEETQYMLTWMEEEVHSNGVSDMRRRVVGGERYIFNRLRLLRQTEAQVFHRWKHTDPKFRSEKHKPPYWNLRLYELSSADRTFDRLMIEAKSVYDDRLAELGGVRARRVERERRAKRKQYEKLKAEFESEPDGEEE